MATGLTNNRLILTNRDRPLGIYQKGLNGNLSRVEMPEEEKGTFNVVPAQGSEGLRDKYILDLMEKTGRPIDEVTKAYDESLAEVRGTSELQDPVKVYQRKLDHRKRIIEFGMKKRRPVNEINSILKMYGYDNLKSPEAQKGKILKAADGRQRYANTGEAVFPDVKGRTGKRSTDKVVRDLRTTAAQIASRLGDKSLTEAIIQSTIKDPKILAMFKEGSRKDPFIAELESALDYYKKEYAEVSGKPWGGSISEPDKTTGNEGLNAELNGNTITLDGKSYILNPDGTVTIDGKRYRVS